MSKGHSQPRTQFPRRNILGRCKNKVSTDNTVIIDVEKGKPEVVDVDEPEPSHQWSRYPEKTSSKTFPYGIISIDDDEDEEDDDSNYNAKNVHDDTCRMFNAHTHSSFCDNLDQNEGSILFGERKHPLEQGKRDCPGASRNHFGLGSDFDSSQSESDSSEFETSEMESDSSDCAILEDVSGTIREQWERAANKKRMLGRNQQAPEDEASATDSSADPGSHCRYSSEKNPYYVNYDNETINGFEEIHVSFSTSKADNQMSASCRSASGACKEEPSCKPVKEDAAFVPEHGVQPKDGVSSSRTECSTNNIGGNSSLGSFPFHSSLHHNIRSAKEGVLLHDKGQPSKDSTFTAARDAESSFQASDRPSASKAMEPGFQESSPGSSLCLDIQNKEDHLVVGPSQHNLDRSNGNEICGIDEGAVPGVPNDLLSGREKHKDSDEYKRAVEEEWASRRRELQMQAEEAQRLKKRRKAESMRLLEMEKRQRQRIEEIRETQKKDEETIHLKEKFRVEVRRELDKIEATYKDMASVLRALGIPVGSGPFPLSHEVNNAYKKALLRFHPDRASRTNVREQVEAEEKFKLISRLKDKLLC